MTRNEIMEKLREILLTADDKKRDAVAMCTEDSNLMTDLGFTSVGMLYMVIAIEEEFGIVFDNIGASDFVTIGDVVDYIEAKLK